MNQFECFSTFFTIILIFIKLLFKIELESNKTRTKDFFFARKHMESVPEKTLQQIEKKSKTAKLRNTIISFENK